MSVVMAVAQSGRRRIYRLWYVVNSAPPPPPPDKSAYLKIIFLISQPKNMLWVLKICLGDHPKHMIKLMDKKKIAILRKSFLLIGVIPIDDDLL